MQGIPATFSLTIGAGIIWLFFGILVGVISAVKRGQAVGSPDHGARADRHLDAGVLARDRRALLPRRGRARRRSSRTASTSRFTQNPFAVVLPPDPAVDRARGALHRLLRARAARQHPRHDQRGLRAHGEGEGPRRRGGSCVKHVLRTSLIPIVTLFGLDFASVLGGGAILTETVFDLHGVGQYAAQSINNFDLPPIMGVTLYGAFFIVDLQRARRPLLRVPRPADQADVMARAPARGRRPQRALRDRGRHRPRGRRRLVRARARQGARHRRRVRLGQERDRDDDHGPDARRRTRASAAR